MNWGNLGIAMGAGVDEMHKQRATAREEEAAQQRNLEFGRKQKDWATQDDIEKRQKEISDWYSGRIGQIETGNHYGVADELSGYHNDTSYLGDSKSRTFDGANGKKYVAAFPMGEGQGMPALHEITPELTRAQLEAVYRHRMEQVDPRQALAVMKQNREFGLKEREVGAKEREVTGKEHYQDGILNWHNKQAERPQFMQDGTGRVMAINPEGKLLGTYGSARPVAGHGGGSGGGMGLTDDQASLLNQAMQYEEYAKQLAKSDPKAAQAYRTASVRALDGLPAKVQLGFRGKFGNAPQEQGYAPVAGNPGMFSDGAGGYAQFDGKNMVPVQMPSRPGQFAMKPPGAPQQNNAPAPTFSGVSVEDLANQGYSAKSSGFGRIKVVSPGGVEVDGAEFQRMYGVDPKRLPSFN